VPQGSILGPLLFCLFIDDMSEVTNSCSSLLYADDTKCFKRIDSIDDCLELQSDLENLQEWGRKWNLNFNAKKCKVLTVTRKQNPVCFNYNLNCHVLEKVSCIKDLGIKIDSELKWSNHINYIVSKANRMLHLVKRSVGYSAPPAVKKQLYLSLVRSNIEYCSQVWSGTTRQNIIKLERVQRSASRYILGYPDGFNYKSRLSKLNLLPLSYRREMQDIVYFYKCLNNVYHVDLKSHVSFVNTNRNVTRNTVDSLTLIVPKCNTECRKQMYFCRITKIWNSINFVIKRAKSVHFFKSAATRTYTSYFNSNYDCDNVCTWTVACNCSNCRLN
jgi:hypothetical protein